MSIIPSGMSLIFACHSMIRVNISWYSWNRGSDIYSNMRSRSRYRSCSKSQRASTCPVRSFSSISMILILSDFRRDSIISSMSVSSTSERVYRTWSRRTSFSIVFCSRSVSASLSPPRATRAMSSSASFSALIFSSLQTNSRRVMISALVILRKSNLSVLDRIVSGTFSISVVARMNFTWFGGSSRVFRRALNAPVESIWTSSMI